MSGRRNGSVSRAAEAASKNRLHMDRNPQHTRITDPANPAGRRKEIDNVMKRARRGSPGTWDRKLLEVEERDPNRSPIGRRSRSPLGRRTRSPLGRRSRTPLRRSRSPIRRSRSPVRRTPRKSRSRSPRNVGKPSAIRRGSAPRPRSPPPRPRLRPGARPPSPPEPSQTSGSGSSMSSCSDESCSVCSAKNKKSGPIPPKPRPPEPSSKAVRPGPRAVQPTRELLKAREASKRTREEKVLEWQRSQLAVAERCPPLIPTAHIKREGEPGPRDPRQEPREPRPERVEREKTKRGVSPGAIMAALADTGSDSDNSSHSDNANQRMTLSERFGKMAQWSAARSARLENMKITRRSHALHVSIEKNRDEAEPEPEPSYPGLEAAPVGSYPEELLAAAPGGLPSWDDVTVRYDYYKKRGYLRGLTLGDYVKWEEWWYKYQEWLKRERAYERWADGELPPPRRERRRRGGRHRRS